MLDLAFAIVSREENRAGAKLAVHVTEAINGIMQAARSGGNLSYAYGVQPSCTIKEGLTAGENSVKTARQINKGQK